MQAPRVRKKSFWNKGQNPKDFTAAGYNIDDTLQVLKLHFVFRL